MPIFLRVTLSYFGGMLLVAAIMTGLAYLMETYLQRPVPNGTIGALGVFIPAILAGSTLVKSLGARPLARELLGFTLWFAVIQFVTALAFLAAFDMLSSGPLADFAAKENALKVGAFLMAFVFLFVSIATRLGLGLGVRSGLKAIGHSS